MSCHKKSEVERSWHSKYHDFDKVRSRDDFKVMQILKYNIDSLFHDFYFATKTIKTCDLYIYIYIYI